MKQNCFITYLISFRDKVSLSHLCFSCQQQNQKWRYAIRLMPSKPCVLINNTFNLFKVQCVLVSLTAVTDLPALEKIPTCETLKKYTNNDHTKFHNNEEHHCYSATPRLKMTNTQQYHTTYIKKNWAGRGEKGVPRWWRGEKGVPRR